MDDERLPCRWTWPTPLPGCLISPRWWDLSEVKLSVKTICLILKTQSSASYLQCGRRCLSPSRSFSGPHVSQAFSWPWHSPVYCSLSPCLIDYLINMLIVWAGSKCDQRFISRRRMGEIRGTLFFCFVYVCGVLAKVCVYIIKIIDRWRGSLTDGVWTKMCWQCLSRSSRTRWPQVDMERNRFTSPVSRSVLFSPEERV